MALTPEWVTSQVDYANQLEKADGVDAGTKALRHRAKVAIAKYLYQTSDPPIFLYQAVDEADALLTLLDKLK